MENLTLTNEMIDRGRSRNGGWSNRQFELLGVTFPAKRGWKKALVGKPVPADVFQQFIDLRDKHLPTPLSKVNA